jgi:hypothetical protein
MSGTTGLIKFMSVLLPVLYDLGRELFERHHGDVEAAKREISRIRNHGEGFQEWEDDLKARLEAIKTKEKPP